MKRYIRAFVLLLVSLAAGAAVAQDIETAENFLDRTAVGYGEIRDYIADLTITSDKSTMKGTVYYKGPNLLRIDFSNPAEQTIVTDGSRLTVYIPQYRVVLAQTLKKRSTAAGASLAGKQGLQLLRRNYSVAYLEGPAPVPLESGSNEMVTKLKLTWRSGDEGFRQIDLSVDAKGLIRRIVGITVGYQRIQYDFGNVRINQNIPDARFTYDPPASANVVENFLFQADN